ncbi:hypothetical protein [Actinoplanes sp. NPDC049316]|uniref:hypothetical protein n=1 Tax=Actinoplanes sp. NPDC049316 TaxID=3154727 RepID=UPI00343B097A
MDRENHLHDQLVGIVAPLVMAPCGPQPADVVRLGGVVRAGVNETRIVLLAGAQASAGVAIEFRLVAEDGAELDVHAAVDWIRTLGFADLDAAAAERDSHGNVVVAADAMGFSPDHRATEYDINYFSMLRQMLYGGGALWFEDIFTLSGFLLTGPGRHRLYITNSRTGAVVGIDLPLTQSDGTIWPGQGGSFPVELPSLVRDDELSHQTKVTTVDGYCSVVYDMADWVLPTPAPEPEY